MSNTATDNTAPPQAAQTPRVRNRIAKAWAQTPIRNKVNILVLLAATGGLTAGVLETQLGQHIWPLLAMMLLVVGGLTTLALRTICVPLEQLTDETERGWTAKRPIRRADLPQPQENEIGRLAQVIHELSVEAYRRSADVNQLRRTMDHRVDASTRRATQQLKQLAMRDPLTDLGNRRFLDEELPGLFTSCRNSHTELLCATLDMDKFKAVNDTLGHAAGDKLLLFLAKLIRGSLRREDIAARLGGDEFIVVMPGCNLERLAAIIERINSMFHQHAHATLPHELTPTLSWGVASLLRDDPQSAALMVEKADANLYAAKHAGRNRTVGL